VLIGLLGFAIGELWNLEDLAQDCATDGVYEFLLASAPLNVTGGIGSPANALAISELSVFYWTSALLKDIRHVWLPKDCNTGSGVEGAPDLSNKGVVVSKVKQLRDRGGSRLAVSAFLATSLVAALAVAPLAATSSATASTLVCSGAPVKGGSLVYAAKPAP